MADTDMVAVVSPAADVYIGGGTAPMPPGSVVHLPEDQVTELRNADVHLEDLVPPPAPPAPPAEPAPEPAEHG